MRLLYRPLDEFSAKGLRFLKLLMQSLFFKSVFILDCALLVFGESFLEGFGEFANP